MFKRLAFQHLSISARWHIRCLLSCKPQITSLRLLFLLCVGLMCACQTAPTATPTITPTPTATATPEIGVDFVTIAPPTAAVVQLTPSPLPTNTPTATPTPIIYTIQAGDTVWSIAYSNGTVPDELLALNPNARPELLAIGQTLVLPPPATPIFQDVDGTPIPLGVRVRSVSVYGTPSGGVWILGEVENEGVFSAETVSLAIALAAPDGTPLGTVNTYVAAPLIPAGERAPFGLFVPDVANDVQVSSTSVTGGSTALTLGNRSLELATFDSEFEIGEESVNVFGRIQNTGVTTTTASLFATVYDSAGNVSGFTQIVLPAPLAPTETQPFSLSLVPVGAAVSDLRIFAFGLQND